MTFFGAGDWNVFRGGGGGGGVGKQADNRHSFHKQATLLNYFEGPRDFSRRKVVQF